MRKATYKDAWRASVNEAMETRKNQWGMVDGYPGVMSKVEKEGGRFVNWHLSTMPDLLVSMNFDPAINISCIYPTHAYAKTFLEWANEAADRALCDIRFTYDPDKERLKGNPDPLAKRGWKTPGIFPGNHGATLAAACFARAMRDNSELDESSLLQAADEIAQSAMAMTSKDWDEMSQSDYLRSIRLALIAGRVDKAQAYFKNNRRKFKFTQEHYTWLQNLCKAIEGANGDAMDATAIEAFQSLFDQVRNPQVRQVGEAKQGNAISTNISFLRLELALIKQRYIAQQSVAGCWTAVLGLISE